MGRLSLFSLRVQIILKNTQFLSVRSFCNKVEKMKFLNVAEKNDAAKNIAGFLSRGASRRREGLSPYNKIYEFEAQVFGQNCKMVMTSVSGHMLNYEFSGAYRSWNSCNPLDLFDAPVFKECPKDYTKVKKTIEREVNSCNGLIIWTDCDREGENIGFEIINTCLAIKPNLRVYRAKFSEITAASVFRALNNLGAPNKNVSDAVDVRQELDLRIGAAFTRLQTLRLKQVFPQKLANNLISYGSCQFPTLGFVVDRFKAIEDFIPENFWKLKMTHTIEELTVEFSWNRGRLFEELTCQVFLDICQEQPTATVTSVESKPKSKWRPLPLDTVEMEKSASRKLKINAKTAMKIAEKLYTQGFISYPRTETNIFPKELNLANLVQQQTVDQQWGPFAAGIIESGGPTPRQGNKSDQAHPPIHPTKYTDSLHGDDKRLYEFIVRHFLACCSKDAKGFETIVDVVIAGEGFQAKGLMIIERNYLDVYPYEKWNSKEIHIYQPQQQFEPTTLEMVGSQTTAPSLLTEADLIALMEKHGIGTDATHAEHISTIQTREYVGLQDGVHFVPGTLGMGLVEGYDGVGLDISLAKPNLRAELEADLKRICDGQKNPQDVLREQVNKYREVYRQVLTQVQQIDAAIGNRINEQPLGNAGQLPQLTAEMEQSPLKCPKCGSNMVIRTRKNGLGKYISCSSFPACKNVLWFPSVISNITTLDENCPTCGPSFKKLKFEFPRTAFPFYTSPHITCIGGCDQTILNDFDLKLETIRRRSADSSTTEDSGFGSEIRTGSQTVNSRSQRPQQNFGTENIRSQRPQQDFGTENINPQQNSFRGSSNTVSRNDANETTWGRSSRVPPTPNNTGGGMGSGWPSFNVNNDNSRTNNRNGDTGLGWSYNSNNSMSGRTAGNNSWGNNTRNSGSNMRLPNSQTTVDGNDVVCGCPAPAILLTVRKAGPNIGRQFYKCAKGKDNGGCDFFLWASDGSEQSTTTTDNFPRGPPGNGPVAGGSATAIQCTCGEAAVRRTVSKENQNKGRSFYCCPKPQGSGQCKFFKWADEVDQSDNGGGDDWGGGGGGGGMPGPSWGGGNTNGWSGKNSRGGSKNKKNKQLGNLAAPYNQGSRGKRKCGLCKQEGHNRTNCPNKDNY